MSTAREPQSKTSWPWIKIALVVSLAINLLVVGFLAGAVARQVGEGGPPGRGPGLGAFGVPYMLALPPEDRRVVLRALQDGNSDTVPDRKARRDMFTGVVGELRAQPFDMAALDAAVSRQAGVTVAVQKRAQAAWMDVVAGMTDTERLRYADAVEEILNRKRRR